MKTIQLATASALLLAVSATFANGIDENTYGQEKIPAITRTSVGTFAAYPGLDENAYGTAHVRNPDLGANPAVSTAVGGPGFDENAYGQRQVVRSVKAPATHAARMAAPKTSAVIDENTYGQERFADRASTLDAPAVSTASGGPGLDENTYGASTFRGVERTGSGPTAIGSAPGFDENRYGYGRN